MCHSNNVQNQFDVQFRLPTNFFLFYRIWEITKNENEIQ